ncbi:porin family protein [Hydrogenophaga sp. MI9]|uniref:porin family protein n=1 Tax=Hydrogenophaga sp. MI9 TaxID=3453719 RepID=UPI003EEBA598
MKKLVLVSLLGLAAVSAQAQSVYADVAYQMFDTDLTTDPAAVRGIVGYKFNPNLSVEGMLGAGVRDGKDASMGATAKVKLDRLAGIYAKSSFKVNDSFELYGRLGYVNYKATASASAGKYSAKVSDSGSDVSYGVGASYYLSPNMSVNVDYMNFGDLEGGVAVGLKFSF